MTNLECEGIGNCSDPVAYIDDKGFVYCTAHGVARKAWRRCRKLTRAELKRLRVVGSIPSYEPRVEGIVYHDAADEYEAAAEWCAARGYSGYHGSPLPPLMSSACKDDIDADPEAFAERVRAYAYGLAMERVNGGES